MSLASEEDRPFKIPLLVFGAFLVLYGLLVGTQRVWVHIASRKGRKLQFEEWTAIARARGFVVERGGEEWTAQARARGFEVRGGGNEPVMRGTVASRPFELDSLNFFGYGIDAENALRFRVEDVDATLSITSWETADWLGDLHPAVGEEAFGKRSHVRANAAGLRWLSRFGPKERQLLAEFPELDVDQMRGEVRIRLPYRIDLAHLDAACRLAESVWGPPPNATSEG